MKRWTNLLGRIGTVLISISLALLLVSLIPQPQLSRSEGSGLLLPEQIQVAFYSRNLNPQQEVEITVTVEGTIKAYLLEISVELEFVNGIFDYGFNLTDLQELLEEHPDQIIWEREVKNGYYKRSYVPTRVMNVTVVFSNPSSETATVEHEVVLKSTVAPGEKVRNIAFWTTPIGIILAIPWLVNIWRHRKQK